MDEDNDIYLVDRKLLLSNGEDDIDAVVAHSVIDLRNGRIILYRNRFRKRGVNGWMVVMSRNHTVILSFIMPFSEIIRFNGC